MTSTGFFDVFSDGGLQIGPVYLWCLGIATRFVTALGLPVLATLAAAQAALVTWLGISTAGRAARRFGTDVLQAQWAIGLVLVLGGYLAESIGNGHPEEITVGLLLAHAALLAKDRRYVLAGLLVGLSTGVKQWGIFGGGVLGQGRSLRGLLLGGAAALGLVALLYAPFFIWGDVQTYKHQWGFTSATALGSLEHSLGLSDWGMRFVQGALAGLAGLAIAWWGKASPLVTPIVAIAVRLVLDPMRLTYYSGPLVVLLVLWAWTTPIDLSRRGRLVATCASPMVVLTPYLVSGEPLWWTGTVALCAAIVVPLALEGASARGTASAAGRQKTAR
nr:glycosyltransferase 87 family protein [Cellulomonas sp. JH27-2]